MKKTCHGGSPETLHLIEQPETLRTDISKISLKKALTTLAISSSDSSSFSAAFSSTWAAAATGAASATGAATANASGLARYSFTYDNGQQIHSLRFHMSDRSFKEISINNASLGCSEFSVYTTNHMGQLRQTKETLPSQNRQRCTR